MAGKRIGGIIELKVDGAQLLAKGEFTCNPGKTKREAVIGQDAIHGYKETPQVGYIEGSITADADTDLNKIFDLTETTATVTLANGQIFVLRNGYFAGDNTLTTTESEVQFRMEGEGEFVR